MRILLYKAAISGVALVVLWVALRWLRDESRAKQAARWLGVPTWWILTRVLPWIVIYFVAGFTVQSDVATTFWPQARGIVDGGLPYRDFESFFGPLFPCLIALPLLVWKDPRAIILFLSLLEAMTAALTLRAARVDRDSPERVRLLAIYFLAPGPLLLAVVGGQEDFLLWTGGLLLWLAYARKRDFRTGLLTVACTLLTKPLFVIPAAAFFGLSRRRWRFLAGALPASLVVLFALWQLTGREFLRVLSQSGNVSPPNIWIWLHWLSAGFIPIEHPAFSLAMLGLVTVFGLVYFARYATKIEGSQRYFFAAWTVLFVVSLLLNLKSLGAYVAYFSLPALILFHQTRDRLALAAWFVLGTLAPIESSLWYRTGERLLTGLPPTRELALEYGFQGLMLASLVIIGLAAQRALREAPDTLSPLKQAAG